MKGTCFGSAINAPLVLALLVASLLGCQREPNPPAAQQAASSSVAAVLQEPPAYHASRYQPDRDLPGLFARVQVEKLFPDSKTFVDAIPLLPPAEIMARYQEAQAATEFDLKAFVQQHFRLPEPLPAIAVDTQRPLREHLRNHWQNLQRQALEAEAYSTLIPLPNPYIVPGGRFREMFYWDSYFTLVGLLLSEQDELALGMIDNFAQLIDRYGFIPNGNRSYFLDRSQPPFFAAMLQLYGRKHGLESVVKYLPQLEHEYQFWMDGQVADWPANREGRHLITLANGDFLNRYYGAREVPRAEAYNTELGWAQTLAVDNKPLFFRNLRAACESGWDFSSRWFGDGKSMASIHALDIIPVDLTALLYSMETTLADFYQHQQLPERAAFYAARAEKRQQLLHQYHYDAASASYQDFNIRTGKFTGRMSLAMVYPLYFGAATPESADKIAQTLAQQFLKPGGLVTSLSFSGEQWDYPNGWAPLQYLAVEGLLRYGHKDLALDVARRWLALNERVYREEGKMMEKYNVVDVQLKAGGGNYPNQDGFGWTNGVALAFYHLLEQDGAR